MGKYDLLPHSIATKHCQTLPKVSLTFDLFNYNYSSLVWICFSSLITPYLIFVTHHSSLKYQTPYTPHHLKYPTSYPPPRLAPSLTCHHSIFFNCLWDPHTNPMLVDFSLSLSLFGCLSPSFFSAFSLHPC